VLNKNGQETSDDFARIEPARDFGGEIVQALSGGPNLNPVCELFHHLHRNRTPSLPQNR
jgi:hypothetical protein